MFEKVNYLITTHIPKKMEDSQVLPSGFNRFDEFRLPLYSLALEFGTELQTAADSICEHVGRVLHCFVTKRGHDAFGSKISASTCRMRPSKRILISLLKKADVSFHQKLLAFLIEDCDCLNP